MAYACPRCGEKVSRGHSGGAQMAAGLVGALFYAAFGAFQCPTCGKIPKSEFPTDIRSRMARGTAGLVIGAVAILAVVIVLLGNMD